MAAHVKTDVPLTDDPGWKLLLGSLDDCNIGTFGLDDGDLVGKPIMVVDGDPWKTTTLFGKVDIEHSSVGWGYPHHAGLEMCPWCRANRTTMPYNDLRPGAPWRVFRLLVADIIARMKRPLHPLTQARFFTKDFLRGEQMHVLDCNGVISATTGSVLVLLYKHEQQLGGTIGERIESLNVRKASYYERYSVPCRMPYIKANNCILDGYAFLHGKGIKAANTRHLLPWIVELVQEFFPSDSQEHKSIRKHVLSLNHIVKLLYSQGFFLDEAAKHELEELLFKFNRHLQWLANDAVHRRLELVWQIRPKHHYFAHFGTQARLINPRVIQAYLEEGLVGKMCDIFSSAANGPQNPKVLQGTSLHKYLCAVVLRMQGYGRR